MTRPQSWVLYLDAGILVVLAYYLAVWNDAHDVVRVVLYSLVSTSSAIAVLYGCRRFQPTPRLPWVLLGLGQAVYAAADISFYTAHYILDVTTFPALADAFYLGHYPLIVIGLLLLVRLRTPGGDRSALLDAAMVAVVAGMLSWLYLIAPHAHADAPALARMVSVAYPMLDLAMFAAALRLILGPGQRPMAFYFLSTNLLAYLAADSFYVYQQLSGSYQAGNFLDAIWLAGNVAFGAAALHPTMNRLGQPSPTDTPQPGPMRTAALCAAALIAPATLLVQYSQGAYQDIPIIGIACALLFVLTIARLVGLVADQRRLVITDSLTGLGTRRFFETRLANELIRAKRTGGSVTLLIADLDHFKTINDRYGHPVGDHVLREVAVRLRHAVREEDLVARYGGEEFAVLVRSAEEEEPALIAERLRREVDSSPVILPDGTRLDVTMSVGTAHSSGDGHSATELVTTADRALYSAKAHGRNRTAMGGSIRAGMATDVLPTLRHMADVVDGWISAHEHGSAVGRWAGLVATELGYDPATVRRTELSGRLHDIGKILVPEHVWTKAEPLTNEERAQIRRHPDDGYRIVRVVDGLADVATVIRQHHERFDGGGYPDGLCGAQIRPEARIVAVCDSWAAMLAERPYHAALTEEQACEELTRCRGGQFDPAAVDAFLRLYRQGRIGQLAPLQHDAVAAGGAPEPGLQLNR